MKECPYCLACLDDNEAKCPYCGYKFPEEEKNYNVVITRVGGNKISVIKEIKEYLNCGLAEAKEKCEKGYVTGNLTKAEADALIAKLQGAGAEAEAVAGELDPTSVERPSDQKGVASTASIGDKKGLIIGVVVGVAIVLTLILLLVR